MSELLEVKNLSVTYASPRGDVQAVRGVSFSVRPGEVLAVVGESGCGKSAMCRAILHLLPGSARVEELLALVGIERAAERMALYPHQLSGGMRQRVVLAIALAGKPKLLFADEPTTALDVTIQAQILDLLRDVQQKLGTATVLVSHDLGVVARVADRVAVMYAGRIVELGTAEEVYYDPRHPYTWALLRALPALARHGEPLYTIPGMPPTLIDPPAGDAFAARNAYALGIDYREAPPMFQITDTHYAATWLLDPRAPKVAPPVGGRWHE